MAGVGSDRRRRRPPGRARDGGIARDRRLDHAGDALANLNAATMMIAAKGADLVLGKPALEAIILPEERAT